ncbi:hypothetical protein CIG75_20420 [Tumebacillus algifaecis]|uniref:Uncharacterized protein n=1 Tax=Tumebacillus algifaecis TaxID=1214604 RepID=A0A223D6G9_9BACL|nr:hypothetical protein [Tumebacillus algifaecis]ASS77033.1 hypothetical protein CIG75_20420 [Tumebacillus algifaecis]
MRHLPFPLVCTVLAVSILSSGCLEKPPVFQSEVDQPEQPAFPQLETLPVPPEEEDFYLFSQRLVDLEVPTSIAERLTHGSLNANMRKFPYPYRGMLAFASDIDDTTPEEFAEYHRFLNTKEETPNGTGVGLDIGDSLWMYMCNDRPNITDRSGKGLEGVMTYFDGADPTKKRYANEIKHYFQKGWIDSMHTFGDFSRKNVKDVCFKRQLAVKAWEEMIQEGITPSLWINHGNEANVDSFGAYDPNRFSRYQAGDDPTSPAYHTDLSLKNGVHFVWNSVGESRYGQDSPLFPIRLRDGQKIWGVHRYTHEVVNGKNDWTWVPREVHRQLTAERLDRLAEQGQYAILGQHFGGYNIGFPFDEKGVAALRLLERYQDQGTILVARTSRLLQYAVAYQHVKSAVVEHIGETWINITAIDDPLFGPQPLTLDAVRGLTFYVEKPERTHLLVDGKPLPPELYQVNQADQSGRSSIGIRWFPRDVHDYSYQNQDENAQ